MGKRIRIVSDTGIANATRVLLDDGTDVTRDLMVTRVGLDLTVGELNRATLELIAPAVDVVAELGEVRIRHLPRHAGWRWLRLWNRRFGSVRRSAS